MVDHTKLEPECKSVTISQSTFDDFSRADEYEFSNDDTKVNFKAVWNNGKICFSVAVEDMTFDENDSIKVYVDKYNSKTKGIATKMIEVKRNPEHETDSFIRLWKRYK